MKFPNWKTTIAGLIGAIGAYLMTQDGSWGTVGKVLVGVGSFGVGLLAKDHTNPA